MSRTDHSRGILRRLPSGPCCMVEVGVCRGRLSDALLGARNDLRLLMVDHWIHLPPDDPSRMWSEKNGEQCSTRSSDEVEDDFRAACAVRDQYSDRCGMLVGDSVSVANSLDGLYDMVFIDADHKYESVVADIDAWSKKVLPGGWVGGHDYDVPGFGSAGAEVKRAVDEFAARIGVMVELDSFFSWFCRIPEPE